MNDRPIEPAGGWERRAARMVQALGRVPPRVAAAMRSVPRHRFLSPEQSGEAYDDTPLPLGNALSTISAPHMVALQLEWAELAPGLRVLEIGSGSGYLLALIAELVRPGGRVVGVELDEALVRQSGSTLARLGYGAAAHVVAGDGREGWPAEAPYDRILLSAASRQLYTSWVDELATPGILIAPIGSHLRRLIRTPDSERWEEGPECRFVELRPSKRSGPPS